MGKKTRYDELCRLLTFKVKGATINSADKYLQGLYKIILEQLELNGEFVLPKFGKFYIEHVEDREMIATGKNREKNDINKKYGVVSTHGNAKDIPLKATVAELFEKTNQKRKD